MGYAARFMEEAALTDSEILAFASEEGYFWLDFHRFVRGFACVDVTASGALLITSSPVNMQLSLVGLLSKRPEVVPDAAAYGSAYGS